MNNQKLEEFIEENRHFIEESVSLNEWEVIEVSDVRDYFTTEQTTDKLRQQFFDETGCAPVFAERLPYIKYIKWLENKLLINP